MLRNVLLMATSGLVLFSKEFVNAVAQPRLTGSLLTAMLEFSSRAVGMPVSYLEMDGVAVTVVVDDAAKIFCALFHDAEDGVAFSRLLASEVLSAFVDTYAGDLGTSSLGHNLKDFHGFHQRVSEATRGVQKVLLVSDDSVAHSTVEVDQLGVLANLQALVSLSTDLMTFVDDAPQVITLESSRHARTLICRVQQATLVVTVKRSMSVSRCKAAVDEAVDMLRKLCVLQASMHGR